MGMNFNPMQLLGMMQNSKNPKQMVLNALRQTSGNNPMTQNMLSLANNKDAKGLEELGRNILKSQGRDYDKEFANFKKMYGYK